MTLFEVAQFAPIGAALLSPGYVGCLASRCVCPDTSRSVSDRWMGYVLYSLVYFGIFGLVFRSWIEVIAGSDLSWPLAMSAAWRAVSLLPAIATIGLVGGLIRQSDVVCRLLRWLRLPANSAVESGWQQAMTSKDARLVKVKIRSGEEIWGHYGAASLASLDARGGDLCLERACCHDRAGNLVPLIASRGVWMAKSEVVAAWMYDFAEIDEYESRQIETERSDNLRSRLRANGLSQQERRSRSEYGASRHQAHQSSAESIQAAAES